jgi:hypothetical protein
MEGGRSMNNIALWIVLSLFLVIYFLCRDILLEYSFLKMRDYIGVVVKGEKNVYDFNQPVLYYKWLDREISNKRTILFKFWVPIRKYESNFKKEIHHASTRAMISCKRELKKEVYLR